MALVAGAGWHLRVPLHLGLQRRPQALPATLVGLGTLLTLAAAGLWLGGLMRRRAWVRRTARLAGLRSLEGPPLARRLAAALPDPLEWLARPLLRTSFGRRWADDWQEAGLGEKPSRFLLLLTLSALVGGWLGWRIAGPLLAVALAALGPLPVRRLVADRAKQARRRFGEQLPQALDALAAGLAAGLSFPQAVAYAAEELPQPVAGAMARLARRIHLGHPVEQALRSLQKEHSEEMLTLAVDGIILQRRFGGDLVALLEETAALLRERVELAREVRAVTVQGRLSGLVIGLLVPVSAGILLTANPRYIDVLFDTVVGQALLALALLLQVIGWMVISRLLRIEY